MTDLDNVTSHYERHATSLVEANSLNKGIIFDALAAASITRVVVTFDGEGDSGQIEDIEVRSGETIAALPDSRLAIHHATWGTEKLDPGETGFRDAIEILCYEYLSQEYDGWENNDGAYGEFTFDVADRRIELEFNGRYTDVHTTTHTF